MNTQDQFKLMRKTSLLESQTIANEYKVARFPVAEEFFLKMGYRIKTPAGYE